MTTGPPSGGHCGGAEVIGDVPNDCYDDLGLLRRWNRDNHEQPTGSGMSRDTREKRDMHALTGDGMVLYNPRDKEAAHRAVMEGIATDDAAAVTCRECLDMLYELTKEQREACPVGTATS